MAAPKSNISQSPQHHLFKPLGPKLLKDILERKSILFVEVLKLDFRVLCQPTIKLLHKNVL